MCRARRTRCFRGRRGDVRRGRRLPVRRQTTRRRRDATRSASTAPTSWRAGCTMRPPTADEPMVLEEFVRGEEHSYDSVVVDGELRWYSISRYVPSPLDVLSHPWIQWCVLLPRQIDGPAYSDVAGIAITPRRRSGCRPGSPTSSGSGVTTGRWPCRRSVLAHRGPVHDPAVLRPRHRHVRRGRASPSRSSSSAAARMGRRGAAYLRGPGPGSVDHRRARSGPGQPRRRGSLVVDARLPGAGDRPTGTYEGDGYVIVRDRDTDAVEALGELISTIRLETG